ncbi:hypothetical protein BDQ12DRAFT_342 [Crucibulum laeve]|uniref:Secreted protein n=1 Tax=Crucibulum laeve TaxID=68775 RepID=A0A5C3MH80_9AGAR|nr:hypothetical protein BDQ12DRAFT_342 [Crucibulum laeve]
MCHRFVSLVFGSAVSCANRLLQYTSHMQRCMKYNAGQPSTLAMVSITSKGVEMGWAGWKSVPLTRLTSTVLDNTPVSPLQEDTLGGTESVYRPPCTSATVPRSVQASKAYHQTSYCVHCSQIDVFINMKIHHYARRGGLGASPIQRSCLVGMVSGRLCIGRRLLDGRVEETRAPNECDPSSDGSCQRWHHAERRAG